MQAIRKPTTHTYCSSPLTARHVSRAPREDASAVSASMITTCCVLMGCCAADAAARRAEWCARQGGPPVHADPCSTQLPGGHGVVRVEGFVDQHRTNGGTGRATSSGGQAVSRRLCWAHHAALPEVRWRRIARACLQRGLAVGPRSATPPCAHVAPHALAGVSGRADPYLEHAFEVPHTESSQLATRIAVPSALAILFAATREPNLHFQVLPQRAAAALSLTWPVGPRRMGPRSHVQCMERSDGGPP